jgi:glycosyltransferase involved in cell wall biosynthesis
MSKASINAKTRVLVALPFTPIYRSEMLSAVAADERIELTVLTSAAADRYGLPSASAPGVKFQTGEFIWIREKKVGWQHGVVRAALDRNVDVLVVVGSMRYLCVWSAGIIGRILRKRVVFWTIGWMTERNLASATLAKVFYKLPDSLLVYGREATKYARKLRRNPERVWWISNSRNLSEDVMEDEEVDTMTSIALRKELFASSEDAITLICVSRFIRTRGLEQLLDAAALLKSWGIETNVLLVGDGELRSSLEAKGRELKLRCQFVGAIFEPKLVAPYLRAADVFVAPSMIGLGCMHALVNDLPVVTRHLGHGQSPEAEALIPEVTGFFCDPEDVRDVAHAIVRAAAGKGHIASHRVGRSTIERFYSPAYQASCFGAMVAREERQALSEWEQHVSEAIRVHAQSQSKIK